MRITKLHSDGTNISISINLIERAYPSDWLVLGLIKKQFTPACLSRDSASSRLMLPWYQLENIQIVINTVLYGYVTLSVAQSIRAGCYYL